MTHEQCKDGGVTEQIFSLQIPPLASAVGGGPRSQDTVRGTRNTVPGWCRSRHRQYHGCTLSASSWLARRCAFRVWTPHRSVETSHCTHFSLSSAATNEVIRRSCFCSMNPSACTNSVLQNTYALLPLRLRLEIQHEFQHRAPQHRHLLQAQKAVHVLPLSQQLRHGPLAAVRPRQQARRRAVVLP
eukprot:CAMPEP_0194303278 /NCGR_PEP_ID=MMETSP0171-20130528/1171_1 /TAXON_ID=218684 /ORGANISM="Corethron pennatum, Strain L29A3" /LENGTH=185 /DNA_ID=CAMNT_0039054107 /DNA_START=270 /DNA_END=824 /DNA_ORIENTATION=-